MSYQKKKSESEFFFPQKALLVHPCVTRFLAENASTHIVKLSLFIRAIKKSSFWPRPCLAWLGIPSQRNCASNARAYVAPNLSKLIAASSIQPVLEQQSQHFSSVGSVKKNRQIDGKQQFNLCDLSDLTSFLFCKRRAPILT